MALAGHPDLRKDRKKFCLEIKTIKTWVEDGSGRPSQPRKTIFRKSTCRGSRRHHRSYNGTASDCRHQAITGSSNKRPSRGGGNLLVAERLAVTVAHFQGRCRQLPDRLTSEKEAPSRPEPASDGGRGAAPKISICSDLTTIKRGNVCVRGSTTRLRHLSGTRRSGAW